jgi:Acyltransferase family
MVTIAPNLEQSRTVHRLAWLEATHATITLMILLYHAQQWFIQSPLAHESTWMHRFNLPPQLVFQLTDTLILLSGFSLTIVQGYRPINFSHFWRHHCLQWLWPFWTMVAVMYPMLWALGEATHSYTPTPLNLFATVVFPLLANPQGSLLLPSDGLWWFIPLMLGLTIIFPFLHRLLQRWGSHNLVGLTLILTVGCQLGLTNIGLGETLARQSTPIALGMPVVDFSFIFFGTHLIIFVLGMALAHSFLHRQGIVWWSSFKILLLGLGLYSVASNTQWVQSAWGISNITDNIISNIVSNIVSSIIAPLGLTLIAIVLFRPLTYCSGVSALIVNLGKHSYSFFLVHHFVVDRALNLLIKQDSDRYLLSLFPMVLTTFVLAIIIDQLQPFLQRILAHIWHDIDYILSNTEIKHASFWQPSVGEKVIYRDKADWQIVQLEKLAGTEKGVLCQITDHHHLVWVEQIKLKPLQVK